MLYSYLFCNQGGDGWLERNFDTKACLVAIDVSFLLLSSTLFTMKLRARGSVL